MVKFFDIVIMKDVKKVEFVLCINGKDSIGINIVKVNDVNIVEVVDDVKVELKKFKEDYKGFDYSVIFDMVELII